MGEVKVDITLENFVDRIKAEEGLLPVADVRLLHTRGLVDTGAVMNMFPRDMVEYLGVPIRGMVIVTLADERREEMQQAEGVVVEVAGRSATLPCLVGPPASEPLLGQVLLEVLDLLVDCPGQRLILNPASPIYPSLKLK